MTLLLALFACSGAPEAPPATPAAAPAAPAAASHDATPHSHESPHGGVVKTVGDRHVEAVFLPGAVMFYVSDADQKPLAVDGYTGTATIKGPAGVTTETLMAMGDHLHAPAKLEAGKPASAVLTLNSGGAAQSVSFEVGGVGLAAHDHTSLHGGQVGMWGDVHVEYAPTATEYRFFVTDAHRAPIRSGVTGSVKVGDKVTPLTFEAATGMLSAPGADIAAGGVMLDASAAGTTFSLAFNAPAAAAPGAGSGTAPAAAAPTGGAKDHGHPH